MTKVKPKGYGQSRVCLRNILEMTKLCKWRADQGLLDVKGEGSGCGYKKKPTGDLVVS